MRSRGLDCGRFEKEWEERNWAVSISNAFEEFVLKERENGL